MKQVLAVSGIDTGIGKTYATGFLARSVLKLGHAVTTVKAVQTGCTGISEDIVTHRELMGVALSQSDIIGETCPYLFKKPCSPHLAAEIEGQAIDPDVICSCVYRATEKNQVVLVEGAGGLFVPLTRTFTFMDLVQREGWPVILVSSTRLGSINHTIASLEAISARNIELACLVYNRYDQSDGVIADDSLLVIREYVAHYGLECPVFEMDRDGMMGGDNVDDIVEKILR